MLLYGIKKQGYILTQIQLKKELHYNEKTGEFTRLKKTSNRVNIGDKIKTITNGYYSVCVLGKQCYLHRLAWLYTYGTEPEYIDHINGNKIDNRIENLRSITKKENHKNSVRFKNNTSGVSGVYWNKKNKKWIANICVDKKTIYLGSHLNKIDAVASRKEAEIKYGFHVNHGR